MHARGSSPKFLMCPPDHYEVAYEINPWMHVERPVDQALAKKQWQALYAWMTEEAKAQVELLEPIAGLPDLVFTANAGFVNDRSFIKSRFRHRQRRAEEIRLERWFRKKGYQVTAVPEPYIFEGEGDALFMGEELFAGYHFRSDLVALDFVAGLLKRDYCALELKDRRFYHLDTCFAPLNEKSALVFPGAFEPYAWLTLLEMVEDPIEVREEEALRFACNAICVGKQVLLPSGCPNTAKALCNRGFNAHSLDFSEFIKSGGAAKCLVLRI